MEEIYLSLKNYLVNNNEDDLKKIMLDDKRLYSLISFFLKRNGIYEKSFTLSDYAYYLYIVLKEKKEDILMSMENEEDIFKIFSFISNLILKLLNRKLYKEKQKKEVKTDKEIIVVQKDESEKKEEENLIIKKKKGVHQILQTFKDDSAKLSLKLYFGIDREYRLSVDQICSIIKVKRSTTFTNIKQMKKLLGDV